MKLQLQVLHSERTEAIIAFNKLCFPTDFWKEDDWKDLLADERAVYYAVMDGETIAGDVFIYNWKGEDDYVKIMNLAVHPDYRGQGLAHRLLDHVTEQMRAVGMCRFCGETRASNAAMQRVFEDCGYELNRIEEGYYTSDGESAYKYVLKL